MKTILIIEDNQDVRENTAEILELANYDIQTAEDGVIGVKKARQYKPDIILCDIMMPKLDGYGVLETLSLDKSTRGIPFIFLTAKTEKRDVRKGMNLGADDYLTKPFEEDELLSAIESRLAKAEILTKAIASGDTTTDKNDEVRNLNELKNFFDDNCTIDSFKKGEIIYSEGSHSNKIYLILKGIVKSYKMDESGKELITALHKADDFLGFTSFTDILPYQETATAVEDVELAGVSKKDLKEILERNQNVTLELVNVLSETVSEIKEQLLQMAYSSVQKKTAQTILQFARILNREPDEAIKISRSDLASVAGIATESLIRTLSDFKKKGLIEIEGRTIRILQMEELEMME